MTKEMLVTTLSSIISIVIIALVFIGFGRGIICSADISPKSGSFNIGACDTDSISADQMARIVSTIREEDVEIYAKAIAKNSSVVNEIVQTNKHQYKEPHTLAELISETDSLQHEALLSTLNDKDLFATYRDKLVESFKVELAYLDGDLERQIVTNPNLDQQEFIDKFFRERILLNSLRSYAVGRGPFRPVAKQFNATLPSQKSRPRPCYVNIPNLENYKDKWVNLINNVNGSSVVARTRVGIGRGQEKTPDGNFKLHVNYDEAKSLQLTERKNRTGDDITVIVISPSRAKRLTPNCFSQINNGSEN